MQVGEFAVKKYYEVVLYDFSTELGRRGGGHELLTLCWQLMRASAWVVAQELNRS